MTAHRTVYAVSSGSYSDYHPVCLFPARELAEEYIAIYAANAREAWLANHPDREELDDYRDGLFVEEFTMWEALPIIRLVTVDFVDRWEERVPTRGFGHKYVKREEARTERRVEIERPEDEP